MKRVPNEKLLYDNGLMLLDGEAFTGVGYIVDGEGQLSGEITYRNGLEWGPKKAWFEPGQLSFESMYFMGVVHGKQREWHYNGRLAVEGDYELGFTLRKKRWDEDGNLEEEYELQETDSDYAQLLKFRDIYKRQLDRYKPDEPKS